MPRLTPDYWQARKPPRFAYLRSSLPLFALLLVFSFFLASYSLLSHFRGPAQKQNISWQAWDVVETKTSKSATDGSGEEVAIVNGQNVTDEFVPSIPLDNWVCWLILISFGRVDMANTYYRTPWQCTRPDVSD
jgi:hypothetical protein